MIIFRLPLSFNQLSASLQLIASTSTAPIGPCRQPFFAPQKLPLSSQRRKPYPIRLCSKNKATPTLHFKYPDVGGSNVHHLISVYHSRMRCFHTSNVFLSNSSLNIVLGLELLTHNFPSAYPDFVSLIYLHPQ